jgi:hypothetical protein
MIILNFIAQCKYLLQRGGINSTSQAVYLRVKNNHAEVGIGRQRMEW